MAPVGCSTRPPHCRALALLPRYRHPEREAIEEALAIPGVTSVQVTFHEKRSAKSHAMPPGGFRLCIVNCLDLDSGIAAREKLALSFWSTQRVLKRRTRRATTTSS